MSITVATIDVVNPYTEEIIGSVPACGPEDVDRAVAAARAAFPGWAATPPAERAAYLAAIAEQLSERGDELAATISAELGMPIGLSRLIQVGLPTMTFASMPGLLEDLAAEEIGNSLVVREPLGVVAAITPWNYPLHQIAAKVAPALAAGCTVVLKPSELTPLCAVAFAEICAAVGLPAGVFNLVTGHGEIVGEALTATPASITSPSPAPRASAAGSARSPGATWCPRGSSSAASRPASCSTTPTWRWRSRRA